MDKPHYMYVLECADGTLYTGYTTDVEQRIATHNAGKGAKYTAARTPVKLISFAEFDTKRDAMSAEFHFKRLSRADKLDLLGSAEQGRALAEALIQRFALKKRGEGGMRCVDSPLWQEALTHLEQGGFIIFPTDTVCGLGVSVNHAASPDALYKLKGRPDRKPISWLVGSSDALTTYGADIPPYAMRLAEAFWPGSLTLIVRASSAVPDPFRAQDGTIGLRMPAPSVAADLLDAIQGPIAATSANPSDSPPASSPEDLDEAWVEKMSCPVLGSDASYPSPDNSAGSTVIICTGAEPTMLREGSISLQEVLDAIR